MAGKTLTISGTRFSQAEQDVIERKLGITSTKTRSREQLERFYEIHNCVQAIIQNGFTKIALQFPDSMLADSATVASFIEEETKQKVFILADTSYGSCCVDEVAAEHVSADLVIHYGRACLSRVKRLPVIYVFGKKAVNVEHCCSCFREMFPATSSQVIIMYDVVYGHCVDEIQKILGPSYPNTVFSKLNYPTLESFISSVEEDEESVEKDEEESEGFYCRFGRQFELSKGTVPKDYSIFYIGNESLTLTNLMMTYNRCQFYTYDTSSSTVRKETLNVNRALMKRYYMIQKAKDAQVVGIVVGTLGVVDYLKVIERLKKVLQVAGKKSYLFVMGKLNVAKMANFMEVDIFVLVACPENTLIDSEEFYKPVVTPFEMEVACLRSQEWTGEYITDFQELLPGGAHSVELDEEEALDSTDAPDISLVTGNMRPSYKTQTDTISLSVVQRNQETAIATQHHTSGAEFLTSRSWQGLEQKLGESQVTTAVVGRKGIAAGYTHETGSEMTDGGTNLGE